MSRCDFSNNYDKFAQRKLLLSSDVELNPGPSDMDRVLSIKQAGENKVLNTLLLSDTVFGLQHQFNLLCQFCKVKKLRVNMPKTKFVVFKKEPVLAEINNGLLVVKD